MIKLNKKLIIIFSLCISFAVIFLAVFYLFVNKAEITDLEDKKVFSINKNITVDFNRKVKHTANVIVEPATDIEIVWEDKFLSSKLTVKPKNRWLLDTDYIIRVNNVKNVANISVPEVIQEFRTQSSPKIFSVVPENKAQNVKLDQEMVFNLDSPNLDLISPKIFIEPGVPSHFSLSEDKKSYKLTFENKLTQSTNYKLSVVDSYLKSDNPEGKLIFESEFSTIPRLNVVSSSPRGNQELRSTTLSLSFDQDVNKEDVERMFTVNPKIDGKISWIDGKSLNFVPSSPLSLGTTYTITIPSGIKTQIGSFLENEYSYSFTTIGYVNASFSPGYNSGEVGVNSPIKTTFNQAVDHASAESKYAISPNVNGYFGWSGNTMIYYPSGQSYLTRYTVSIDKGVKSINGLDSAQVFSTTYVTETPIVKLNVVFDRQDYNLSCEFASLKMALAQKGVYVSENELISRVGYDGPANKENNTWGNPNRGFVGQLNGNGTTTGYGVYWGPIASAANNYRPSSAFTYGNLQTLTNAIDNGNPIVFWGPVGAGSRIDWTDFQTGETVYAVKGEHARVVYGYKGLASNPLGFYIADPIYGYLYWSSGTMSGNWSWFFNSGVIVH